jgi:hypothetical protein
MARPTPSLRSFLGCRQRKNFTIPPLFPCQVPLLLLMLMSLVQRPTDAVLHGFNQESPLCTWASLTFSNFPPFFWNDLMSPSNPSHTCGAAFACRTSSSKGFQGVKCDGNQVTAIDLSRHSLPADYPPLEGNLSIPGVIAPPIVALPALQELNLENNRLTNTIPVQLGYSSLKRLNLAGNLFTGNIPTELCNLTCLNVANNNLSGKIPSCFHTFPCVDFQGNPNLTRVPNDCNT